MKRRIVAITTLSVLLLCGAVWARVVTVVVGQGSVPAAPSGQSFSDDFSTDPASRWTKLTGSNWTYDSTDDNVDMVADSTYLYNTQTNTVSQYVCAQLTSVSYNGVAFRSDGNVSNPYYVVRYNNGSQNPEWKYCTGATCSTIEVDTENGHDYANGNYMCVEVSGTGSSTVVDMWIFTSAPPSRGSWGSASYSFTDDPATACDAGKYVGMYTEDNVTYDNFSGGDK